jgi:hypothetical protein
LLLLLLKSLMIWTVKITFSNKTVNTLSTSSTGTH